MKLQTLRKRPEFLRVRGGGRWSSTAFVLETKARFPAAAHAPGKSDPGCARFGFTVTKRMGNAVRRNRIRRRLRAALTEIASDAAHADHDYVLIARQPAHDMAFDALRQHLVTAFDRVHRPRGGPRNAKKRRTELRTDSSTVVAAPLRADQEPIK